MIEMERNGNNVTVYVSGRYDFTHYDEVVSIKNQIDKEDTVVIDCTNMMYIDSSGLGSWLELRDRTKKMVKITNLSKEMKTLVQLAFFQNLFEIV